MPTLVQILAGKPLLTLHVSVPGQIEPTAYILQHGISIGRGEDNAICVDHCDLMHTHARIYEDLDTGELRAVCHKPFNFTRPYGVDIPDLPLRPDAEFYIGEVRFEVGLIELRVPRSQQPEPRTVLSYPPFVARLPAIRAACPRCHESVLHISAAAKFCPRCGLELPENCPPWCADGPLNLSNPALAAYAHALFNLGARYENTADGDDLQQALRYYEKAARIGVTAAKARLESREPTS